jgi:hypothetical protein
MNLSDDILWNIDIPKGLGNSLKEKADSWDIFTWELCSFELLQIVFKSIPCLLNFKNPAFYDASTKNSNGSTLMHRNTVQIQFNFSTKCTFHGDLQHIIEPIFTFKLYVSSILKIEFLPAEVISFNQKRQPNFASCQWHLRI